MKVLIHLEVFHDQTAWIDLFKFLDLFLEARHVWDLSDSEAIEQSPWLLHAPDSIYTVKATESYEACLKQWFKSEPASNLQSLRISLKEDASSSVHTLASGLQVLTQPAWVVVENSQSDGAFLKAISAARQPERERVSTAFQKGWLQLRHAGGGDELMKRVSELVDTKHIPERILVLVDSDRYCPGPDSEKISRLRKDCEKSKVGLVVLSKREIENYLPLRLLEDYANDPPRKRLYAAFAQLSQTQRDFFDIKNGFRSKDGVAGKTHIPEAHGTLFDSLPPGVDLADLSVGFGKHAWELFNKERITRDEIEALYSDKPQDVSEIDALLDQIEGML